VLSGRRQAKEDNLDSARRTFDSNDPLAVEMEFPFPSSKTRTNGGHVCEGSPTLLGNCIAIASSKMSFGFMQEEHVVQRPQKDGGPFG